MKTLLTSITLALSVLLGTLNNTRPQTTPSASFISENTVPDRVTGALTISQTIASNPHTQISCEYLWELLNEIDNMIEDKHAENKACAYDPDCAGTVWQQQIWSELAELMGQRALIIELMQMMECPGTPSQ